jgi:hypothetical protein
MDSNSPVNEKMILVDDVRSREFFKDHPTVRGGGEISVREWKLLFGEFLVEGGTMGGAKTPIFHMPKLTENTSSAMSPLPGNSDAFTGILRAFNGHINGLVVDLKAPFCANAGEPG